MSTATNVKPIERSTFGQHFGTAGLAERVRVRTLTMLAAREGNPTRLDPSVASLRADVRPTAGKKTPFAHLYRIMLADLDAGVAVDRVTLALREMIEDLQQYAARRERRQSSGILPFRQLFTRKSVHGQREECEAKVAAMELNPDCLDSLRKARAELLEEIAADQATADLLTAEIIRLEAAA